jgi:DNA-directed RNA polymerase specialized sigma24 family protein
VPSVLGIDPMRGKVSSYRVMNFEDAVIFIVDVEKCLKKVSGKAQAVLVRIALQEYTVGEAAKMLGVAENTVVKQYRAGLDELTEILLEVGLMKPECLR